MLNFILQILLCELVTPFGCTAILPDNGRGEWLAISFIPNNGGFSLIGQPNGFNVFGKNAGRGECLLHHSNLCRPDFLGILFHPARMRCLDMDFTLSGCLHLSMFIENNRPTRSGSLIECK